MADSYMEITPEGQMVDKSEWLEYLRNNKNRYDEIRVSDMDMRTEGDTAVTTGVYNVKGQTADNQPMDQKVRFIRTLVNKDGRWQAVAAQISLIPE